MNKVRLVDIEGPVIGDERTYVFANDDYEANLTIGYIDEDAPVDPDFVRGFHIRGKNDDVAKEILADFRRTEMLTGKYSGRVSIGDSVFGLVDYNEIGENSGERMIRARKFAEGLDAVLREQFPGYGILYHESDRHLDREEREKAEEALEKKKNDWRNHEEKHTIKSALEACGWKVTKISDINQ